VHNEKKMVRAACFIAPQRTMRGSCKKSRTYCHKSLYSFSAPCNLYTMTISALNLPGAEEDIQFFSASTSSSVHNGWPSTVGREAKTATRGANTKMM